MTDAQLVGAVVDPDATLRQVGVVLAARHAPASLRTSAWHAAAMARFERGELSLAARAARHALNGAVRAADATHAAELRLLLAWIEQDRGNVRASIRQLDLAQPRLRGALLARARCLRGLGRCVGGEYDAASRELSAAIAGMRRHGDPYWLANALVGRGVVRSYLLRLPAAEADLAAAKALFTGLGLAERAAICLHNLGFVAMQAGDIPLALGRYDDAVAAGLQVGGRAEALVDRALALLAAGMVVDAGEVLERASDLLGASGRGMRLAEASLALGQCALRAGRHGLARKAVRRARELFRTQGRVAWLAAADSVGLRVRLATAQATEVARASAVAQRCVRHGWRMEAAELRLHVADMIAGDRAARRLLSLVEVERQAGPARLRAVGWLARAKLAELDGDRRRVFAACRAGLRVVEDYAALMGALELQAGAAGLAGDLARTGLAAALEGGHPAAVLRWTERCRAAALRIAPVRPPNDGVLADGLVELRAAGMAARDGADRRLAALESAVRMRSLAAAGHVDGSRDRLREEELAECLGRTALLSFTVHDGRLWVVSVVDRRARLRCLGEAARITAEVDALRFALGLQAHTGRDRTIARRAASRLDEALLAPLGDRPLVVVPTGALHGLPWAALDSCAGRAVSVAPSATAWLRAARSARPVADRPVWVAGPGLRHADHEVVRLHRRFGGSLLTSDASTVDTVMSAMDGAGLVHIAAHGRFRADAPMFSCLELADGPLYGYDLDRLPRAPRWLVLSSCEGALSAVRASDELIGLAAVLLRRGTTALIASTLPVPDEAAADLVTALHTHLRAGHRPAAALAVAQATHGHLGFVCLGAG